MVDTIWGPPGSLKIAWPFVGQLLVCLCHQRLQPGSPIIFSNVNLLIRKYPANAFPFPFPTR